MCANKNHLESVSKPLYHNQKDSELRSIRDSTKVLPKLPQKHRFHFKNNAALEVRKERARENNKEMSTQQHQLQNDTTTGIPSIPRKTNNEKHDAGSLLLYKATNKSDEGWVTHTSNRLQSSRNNESSR